jgi:hypothetical protein
MSAISQENFIIPLKICVRQSFPAPHPFPFSRWQQFKTEITILYGKLTPLAIREIALSTPVTVHIVGCEELRDAKSDDEDMQAFEKEST